MLKLKEEICGQCGACVAVCGFDALRLESEKLKIFLESCTLCGDCVVVCPVFALEIEND